MYGSNVTKSLDAFQYTKCAQCAHELCSHTNQDKHTSLRTTEKKKNVSTRTNKTDICNTLKYKHSLVSLPTCVDPIGCWQNIPVFSAPAKYRPLQSFSSWTHNVSMQGCSTWLIISPFAEPAVFVLVAAFQSDKLLHRCFHQLHCLYSADFALTPYARKRYPLPH